MIAAIEESRPADVEFTLRQFAVKGSLFELRAPGFVPAGADAPTPVVWRFEAGDVMRATRKALELSEQSPAVYVTMNPIRPGMPTGRVTRGAKAEDIVRRRWMLVDIDPVRPVDTSSTDAEKAAAMRLAIDVREDLSARGWPAPIVADSGNGWHLLYRVDLPADDGGLIRRVLIGLAQRFDTPEVKIDRKVFDPCRIVKVYGTMTRKGPGR